MKKPFLLIYGDVYYPSVDTYDWQGCFETYEKAEERLNELRLSVKDYVFLYKFHNIVDLRDWTE